MKYELNPDKNEVFDILQTIVDNEGYCPCQLEKNDDTRCMCKLFRDETRAGEYCHCGLYYKIEE